MVQLIHQEENKAGLTSISNDFLDRFLPEANGDFVKTYLLLLRLLNARRQNVTVVELADRLNVTESDIKRALRYWEKVGQLKLQYNVQEELIGISFLREEPSPYSADPSAREAAVTGQPKGGAVLVDGGQTASFLQDGPVQPASPEESKPKPKRSAARKKELCGDEDFVQLLYVVQKYLGKTLTGRDADLLAYWYQDLHFPAEVIEYMVETCVSNGHSSMRYIEKVALDWHERGLMTVDKAKAYNNAYRNDYFRILKAFGISNRNPAAAEVTCMERWLNEYGFSVEVVIEACNRTMEAIHEPSFKYAESILKKWKDAGCRSREDIQKLDGQYKNGGTKAPAKQPAAAPKNRFHNFEQRTYDYGVLLKQINKK